MCEKEAVIALDANLNKTWDFPLDVEAIGYCFPTIHPDTNIVYIPIPEKQTLLALDAHGTRLWESPILWSESSPAIAPDGTVYIGTADTSLDHGNCDSIDDGGDGFLFAINPDGTQKWRFDVPTWSQPDEDGDGSICYDNTQAIDSSAIVGSDGTIYFGTDSQHFFAVNPDGTEKWRISGATEFDRTSAIAPDGTLYFAPAGSASG